MGILKLHELVDLYRDEIIRRCEITSAPQATGNWMDQDLAAFLDQLMVELRDGPSRADAINEVVSTVSPVTQPYRGVGRSVVDLALELNVPISADDCLALDRCLDAAIARAVTQHVSRRKIASD